MILSKEVRRMENKTKTPRLPKLWEALLTLGFLVALMAAAILVYEVDPHIPMFIGALAAALMALRLGYRWKDVENFMFDGIQRVLQSLIILVIIGILIGVWLNAGVVPAMIYYGLQILNPTTFLMAAMLVCSVTSLATGTSWGTVGTVGVALMGIGLGLGMDPAMTGGAILSGAYFGDKISPFSETTNLAPAMAGTDVMTHVKFMLMPTAVVYVITLGVFGVLSFTQYSGGEADMSTVVQFSDALAELFHISPILLLPPVVVIVAVACKMPAIPGITLGVVVGGILGLIFQPDCTLGTLLESATNGFSCDTGVYEVDELLNSGGLMNMMYSISLAIIAMMFGGVMEGSRQLEVIVDRLKKLAKTPASLVTLTEATCVVSNVVMPEQYISIVVPGRMYAEEYGKMKLHPKTLSNALESAGTVTSALVPWNTCGVFMATTLGLSTISYAPWAIFNWLMPIVVVVMAFMGLTVAGEDGIRLSRKKKQG